MIISTEFNQEESTLITSYYDPEGKVAFIRKPIQQMDLFNWTTTPNPTEFRNWDNKFLKKTPSKWLSRFRLEELTQERLAQIDLDKLYSDYSPRKYFFDIEIKLISQDFPDPAKALMEVNLISLVNDDNVVYTMSTTENFNKEEIGRMESEVNEYLKKCGQVFAVKYMYFETELAMLQAFFKMVLPKIPFLTGWNVIGFDWIYLMNRAKRIGIEPMEFMPCEKLIGQAKLPIHMGLLDYMEVFMNTKPYKVVENYKLDYIADLVLGVTKLHNEYATMLEAQKDTFNFAKYNIIDTCLVKLIDDKLGLLEVAFAISKFARIEVSKVFSAVFITETLMCREFLEKGKFLANDKRDLDEEATYDGAYVMKPVPGFYKYIMLDDFASMYPNLTIQFNMSPDAFMGKIKPDMEIPTDVIFTKNDTIFTNKFDSVARTILTRMYNGRVDTKAQMKKLEELLESEKISGESSKKN
jgi:DNA polymerase elongation subunit (family B)